MRMTGIRSKKRDDYIPRRLNNTKFRRSKRSRRKDHRNIKRNSKRNSKNLFKNKNKIIKTHKKSFSRYNFGIKKSVYKSVNKGANKSIIPLKGYHVNSPVRFVNLNDVPFSEYNKYCKIIINMKSMESVPLLGLWTKKMIDTLKMQKNAYFIMENNNLAGIALFQNLSGEFRRNMLGKLANEFKSIADPSSIFFYYTLLHKTNEENIEKNIINKRTIDILFDKFIRANNLFNKNFVIILLQFLENQNDIIFHNLINKYIPIVDYIFKGVEKIKNLGFEYNGYHINLNNDIINVFMKRYIKSSGMVASNYFPTYIITRQLDNYNASKMVNFENMWNKENLYPVKNVYRYCLNNTLVYYTNFIDNEIYSIYKSTPYEFNYIINFITNELGNNHIICNYPILYNGLLNHYGEQSKELTNFAPVVRNIDDVYNLLDNKGLIILRNFNIFNDNLVNVHCFNTKDKFHNFFINNSSRLQYGYYAINMSYALNQIPIKDNMSYFISKSIVFTYINNEFKVYVGSQGGILIRNFKVTDIFTDKELDYNLKILMFPDDYKSLSDDISDKDIEKISELITENCKIIGRMYRKHVTNDINQINGFRSIHVYLRPLRINGEIKVVFFDTAYFNKLSNRNNYEHSEWLNEIAIKPALYKGYKTSNTSPDFQPLNLDG